MGPVAVAAFEVRLAPRQLMVRSLIRLGSCQGQGLRRASLDASDGKDDGAQRNLPAEQGLVTRNAAGGLQQGASALTGRIRCRGAPWPHSGRSTHVRGLPKHPTRSAQPSRRISVTMAPSNPPALRRPPEHHHPSRWAAPPTSTSRPDQSDSAPSPTAPTPRAHSRTGADSADRSGRSTP